MKVGVILSRCQPLHKGHIEMINRALAENDKVLFIIGSADKSGTERNPFPVGYRVSMFKFALGFVEDRTRVSYMTLNDWSSDENIPKQNNITGVVDDADSVNIEWGQYLYYNIVNYIGQPDFTFYYNDDSSLVSAWFPKNIWDRITIVSYSRTDDISSSSIRKAIINDDFDYVMKCVPYWRGVRLRNMMKRYKSILNKED